jgi:hypothetical protein
MDSFVSKVIASAEDNLAKAADTEDAATAVFYGDQAMVILLGAIFQELHELNANLKKGSSL